MPSLMCRTRVSGSRTSGSWTGLAREVVSRDSAGVVAGHQHLPVVVFVDHPAQIAPRIGGSASRPTPADDVDQRVSDDRDLSMRRRQIEMVDLVAEIVGEQKILARGYFDKRNVSSAGCSRCADASHFQHALPDWPGISITGEVANGVEHRFEGDFDRIVDVGSCTACSPRRCSRTPLRNVWIARQQLRDRRVGRTASPHDALDAPAGSQTVRDDRGERLLHPLYRISNRIRKLRVDDRNAIQPAASPP